MRILILLSFLVLPIIGFAQQTFPYGTGLLANNHVLLASVAYEHFYTHKQFFVSEYTQQGELIKKVTINTDTLSVEKAGEIYQLPDSNIVVFCTFAGASQLRHPQYWGYVLLNNQYQVLAIKTFNLWFPVRYKNGNAYNNFDPEIKYPYVVDLLRIKPDKNGGYYGMVSIYSNGHLIIPYQSMFYRYSTWVRLDANLALLNQTVDTIYHIGTEPYYLVGELGGDIIQTDSGFFTSVVEIGSSGFNNYYFTEKTSGLELIKEKVSAIFIQEHITQDTNTFFDNSGPFIQFKAFGQKNHIVVLDGILNQQRRVNGEWLPSDTGNLHELNRGFIMLIDDTGRVLKYNYAIPKDSSRAFVSVGPAPNKGVDYYDKNTIYMVENADDIKPFFSNMNGTIIVSAYDSLLNKKWIQYIKHPSSFFLNWHIYAQTIQATPDGGCLIFANIAYEYNHYDTTVRQDTNKYGLDPYWHTVVYKVMPDGQVNSSVQNSDMHLENELLVYPNPAKKVVYISSKTTLKQLQLFNATGQLVLSNQVNDKSTNLDVGDLKEGLYFLHCTDNENRIYTNKIIVQH